MGISKKRDRKEYSKEYRIKNKERRAELDRQYKIKNRDKTNKSSSDATRKRIYKSIYNITIDEYEHILKAQDYNCKICKTNQSQFKRRLSVDHCHKTGKVRGILCPKCNTGLGTVNDDVEMLNKMINYLNEFNGK